jgi:hypothetical protein
MVCLLSWAIIVVVMCFLRSSTVLTMNFPVSGLAYLQCFLLKSSLWILCYLYISPLVRILSFYDLFLLMLKYFFINETKKEILQLQ